MEEGLWTVRSIVEAENTRGIEVKDDSNGKAGNCRGDRSIDDIRLTSACNAGHQMRLSSP